VRAAAGPAGRYKPGRDRLGHRRRGVWSPASADEPAWVLALRDRCAAAEVPFFFKQWGGRTPKQGGRLLDGRVWDQTPVLAHAA